MKKMNEKIIFYVMIIAAVAIVVVSLFLFVSSRYGANYSKAISSELTDKCATPSGYTDQQWKEHMSHHPDRYTECLT